MQKLPTDDWQPLAPTPVIKPSNRDPRVAAIRLRLVAWGDLNTIADTITDNDVYDTTMGEAVKIFQHRHGLDADGVIGRETLQALNVSPQERAKQIIVNLERWRWLAEDLGNKFLLVNIAAFELKIIDNNETIFTKPVVVPKNPCV